MIEPTPEALLDQLRKWSPEGQEAAATALEQALETEWRPFYCGAPGCDGKPHEAWEWMHARGDQHPPRWPWDTWIELSGRGAGKTRNGSEMTHRWARLKRPGRRRSDMRIALVAPTAADARDIMVEGESGLLATQSPENPCVYEPTKRRVTWKSGSRATLFSAEVADRLRGPQHHFAWVDEACYMPNIQEVWDNLQFGLRLGQHPRCHITTTPKPRPWLKALLEAPTTARTTASTYANVHNLAPQFRRAVLEKYEGTRLGRQEIHAEVLEDIEGALWSYVLIDGDRVPAVEATRLERIVVAVDPPGSDTGAEAGIVVCGRSDGHGYVLSDLSGRMSPVEWGTAAVAAYRRWNADALIAETNYGGDMVVSNLKTVPGSGGVIIKRVSAVRNKQLRAEPVVSLYEQHRVHHVGVLGALESQLTSWVPGETSESPDRLDALVHALTDLLVTDAPSRLSSPASLGRRVSGSWQG